MSAPSSTLITYLGDGPIASRPATPNLGTGLFGMWWATDTKALSIYDLVNNTWSSVGGGGYSGGTVPTIVQSGNNCTGAQGITLGAAPTSGNLLVAMGFNPSSPSVGSGWSSILDNSSGTDYGVIATKTAGGSESATQNPWASAPGTGCLVIWEINGQNGTPVVQTIGEAEQSAIVATTPAGLIPLDTGLLFLGAVGLVSSTGNFVNMYGVVQDQFVKTGSTRQIAAGHASLTNYPVPAMGATISAQSSFKALGLIITH